MGQTTDAHTPALRLRHAVAATRSRSVGTRRREEPFMKRLLVALLVVICMLVVAAPASATTVLTGQYTWGMAYGEPGEPAPSEMALAPSGALNIVIGAPHEVLGALKVTAPGDPGQGPFRSHRFSPASSPGSVAPGSTARIRRPAPPAGAPAGWTRDST